jgi:hypothetical protein
VDFGQGGALTVDQQRADETLRDFLDRRERELMQQISELRRQLFPKESELTDVRRVRDSLGPDTNRPAHVDLSVATEPNLSAFSRWESNLRELTTIARQGNPASLKIKELILRAFLEHFPQGCTPTELSECISSQYGREVVAGSIRPNLLRLREDGILTQAAAGLWRFASTAETVIRAQDQDEQLLEQATKLAWTNEDDEAHRLYEANARAGIPQDDVQTWARKRTEEKLKR